MHVARAEIERVQLSGAQSVLFSPVRIGRLLLSNRIVQAPMHSNFCSSDGGVTDRLRAYVGNQARSGAGFITIEHATVEAPRGNNAPTTLNVSHERYVPGLAELADIVHLNGAKTSLQIDHGGRQSNLKITRGDALISASPIPWVPSGTIPRAMTVDEISGMVERFAEAAGRAVMAGFDAVTIHSGHGYLLNSFLSPFTNQRDDDYGGPIENRMRFLLEIVAACRKKVGPQFPMLVRLNGADHLKNGLTNDEVVKVALALEAASIDCLDMTSGTRESGHWQFPTLYVDPGLQLPDVRAVKRAVKIPLIAIGKINSVELAEEVISSGTADLVAFGRPLLADPEMPRKIREGRRHEIRPCLYCNDCMLQLRSFRGASCTVNPIAGRELYLDIPAAKRRRNILIVGGGPAGLTAAAWASRRGHKVTLAERDRQLGGKLYLTSKLPHRQDYRRWLDHLVGDANRLGVRILTACSDPLRDVDDAEVVILATGVASVAAPPLPFEDGVTVIDILSGAARVGKNVVISDTGQTGSETALYLAAQGHNVALAGAAFAPRSEGAVQLSLMERLTQAKVVTRFGWTPVSASSSELTIRSNTGQEETVPFDTLVVAQKRVPETIDPKTTYGNREVHIVGDLGGTGSFREAVLSAVSVSRQI